MPWHKLIMAIYSALICHCPDTPAPAPGLQQQGHSLRAQPAAPLPLGTLWWVLGSLWPQAQPLARTAPLSPPAGLAGG